MKPAYRPDIDGLRAVAVLAILLYHVGVPGFSGGFVGVDIFYVISGYLITTILAADLAAGTFTIGGFYLRRIRRIFPALFVMLAASSVAAALWLLPLDQQRFGTSLMAAAGFLANLEAWWSAGYFDPQSITKPLLHTWSLAIEEQFYLFFPLILMLVARLRGRAGAVVWGLAVSSLALSLWLVRVDTDAAFYLIPTRAWELLAGAVLALRAVPPIEDRRRREWLAVVGLFAIMLTVFFYDHRTRFPGDLALPPVIGTALLIHVGGRPDKTMVERLLSARLMVGVGLLSYSLYLWHWPIIVFAHHLIVRAFTSPEKLALIALSFIAAWLSWRLVETPFRRAGGTGAFERLRVFGLAAAGIAASMLIGLHFRTTDALARLPAPVQRLIDQIERPHTEFAEVRDNPAYAGFALKDRGFIAGLGGGPPTVAVWGDSHVGNLMPIIHKVLMERRTKAVTIFTKGGCRPLPGTYIGYDADRTCFDHNTAVLDYLKTGPEKRVILVARWGTVLFGDVTPEGTGENRPNLAASPGVMLSVEAARALLAQRLGETIDALTAAGKEVVLVDAFAEIPFEGKRMVLRTALRDPQLGPLAVPLASYETRYTQIDALFDEVARGRRLTRLHPRLAQCPAGQCTLYKDGQIYFADTNHIPWGAALKMAEVFESTFK